MKNSKGSFRRSVLGKLIMAHCAVWIVEKLNASGITFDEWRAKGLNLRDIGVSRASARAELQPRIPQAHVWYSEHGEGRQFETWDDYWAGCLSNRLYYFFRRHDANGKIVAAVAEWPGKVEDGRLIAPEIVEPELLDEILTTGVFAPVVSGNPDTLDAQ